MRPVSLIMAFLVAAIAFHSPSARGQESLSSFAIPSRSFRSSFGLDSITGRPPRGLTFGWENRVRVVLSYEGERVEFARPNTFWKIVETLLLALPEEEMGRPSPAFPIDRPFLKQYFPSAAAIKLYLPADLIFSDALGLSFLVSTKIYSPSSGEFKGPRPSKRSESGFELLFGVRLGF